MRVTGSSAFSVNKINKKLFRNLEFDRIKVIKLKCFASSENSKSLSSSLAKNFRLLEIVSFESFEVVSCIVFGTCKVVSDGGIVSLEWLGI